MEKTINQCGQPAPESSSTPWSLSPVPAVDTQALASPPSWSYSYKQLLFAYVSQILYLNSLILQMIHKD